MIEAPADPKWPRLLSLSVHEFRTPITVVAGYIRMLLKDRAGPLSDQQRRLLEEAEKSCGRLSSLVAEMSELASLEAGNGSFTHTNVDLAALLKDTIAGLPAMPDREIGVELSSQDGCPAIIGDPVRLSSAFASVLTCVRRELVTSDTLCVRQRIRDLHGQSVAWIAFGETDLIDRLERAEAGSLDPFDEWRGGCGLSLAIARRVFAAHHGRVWSAGPDARAAAVVMLPFRLTV